MSTREILFKGKRTDNGEWVEGYYVKAELLDCSGCEHVIIEYSAKGSTHLIDSETACQYTGLTDKNGKKIFEGDIVKQRMGRVCKVVFKVSNGYCGFDLIPISGFECAVSLYSPFLDLEVIGNIHDK